MKTDIQRILNLNKYFRIANISKENVTYNLESPSKMLIENIKVSWLRSLFSKTHKHFPVYINKSIEELHKKPIPFGLIKLNLNSYKEQTLKQNLNDYSPEKPTVLEFSMILHHRDLMPYFIQWQRYRKYWWSSITTTPSLFCINDIRNGDGRADVDIAARFNSIQQPVETVSYSLDECEKEKAKLSCAISLESALITLLLDSYNPNQQYLRIHRKMAPYKISIAVNCTDPEKKESLMELASLLNHKLELKQIPTWFPDRSQPIDIQLKDALQIGVPYTAIIDDNVLVNGIFHLLNSSTMLREQVHVADFDAYAKLLFEN